MTSRSDHADDDPTSFARSDIIGSAGGDFRNFVVTQVLPNGRAISIRAIRPDDKERMRAAFANLESRSVYMRFFGYKKELTDAEMEQATEVDFDQVVALVGTIGSGSAEVIIAGARYVRGAGPASSSAEVAFVVEEDYQGQGIASCLFDHLISIARRTGLSHLEADVLASNGSMLAVFARSGLPLRQHQDRGVIHVILSLDAETSQAS
jgi:GNAT superfamily N-acetyltransferase